YWLGGSNKFSSPAGLDTSRMCGNSLSALVVCRGSVIVSVGKESTMTNKTLLSSMLPPGGTTDLVCFSHLRWDFVYQRPQHLLSRSAKTRRVFFVEEPVFGNCSMRLVVREAEPGLHVVVPHLPEGLSSEVALNALMKEMTRQLFLEHDINEYVFWYYTPMALSFTEHFNPIAAVYD